MLKLDRRFLKAQSRRAGFGILIGSLAAIAVNLFARDQRFRPLVHRRWIDLPTKLHFEGFHTYKPEVMGVAVAVLLLLLPAVAHSFRTFARAWWAGITSVLAPVVGSVAVCAFLWGSSHPTATAVGGMALIFSVLGAEFWRSMEPLSSAHERLNPKIPLTRLVAAEGRWNPSTGDDPITDWDQDVIGRTAVVEVLADHVLRQRTPVVALHGELGDGKTSVLNLLRWAITDRAIVVSFSAWLPGSDATLSTDLFADIATECRRYIRVPQLRRRALAYAKAIGGSLPPLAGLRDLLPTQSQRDDIQELRESFGVCRGGWSFSSTKSTECRARSLLQS